MDTTATWLLTVAAAVEAATGIALIAYPLGVARLLFGADLAMAGIALGRVAGVALLSLGVGCWMSRQAADRTPALSAMLTYNLLVATYLAYLAFDGELGGILLLPAIALHAVLTLLFAYARFIDRRTEATTL